MVWVMGWVRVRFRNSEKKEKKLKTKQILLTKRTRAADRRRAVDFQRNVNLRPLPAAKTNVQTAPQHWLTLLHSCLYYNSEDIWAFPTRSFCVIFCVNIDLLFMYVVEFLFCSVIEGAVIIHFSSIQVNFCVNINLLFMYVVVFLFCSLFEGTVGSITKMM
jgi:hypothetical protein